MARHSVAERDVCGGDGALPKAVHACDECHDVNFRRVATLVECDLDRDRRGAPGPLHDLLCKRVGTRQRERAVAAHAGEDVEHAQRVSLRRRLLCCWRLCSCRRLRCHHDLWHCSRWDGSTGRLLLHRAAEAADAASDGADASPGCVLS